MPGSSSRTGTAAGMPAGIPAATAGMLRMPARTEAEGVGFAVFVPWSKDLCTWGLGVGRD